MSPLRHRLKTHYYFNAAGKTKLDWLKSMMEQGVRAEIVAISKEVNEERAAELEERWVNKLRPTGLLTNGKFHTYYQDKGGGSPGGEDCHLSKLTESIVSEIKTHLIAGTMTQSGMGRKYGVDPRTINAIRLGYSWAHVLPLVPAQIPQPHRKMSAQDHIDIFNKWNAGAKLEKLAQEYGCRIDTITRIKAKMAKKLGEPYKSRRFQPRFSTEVVSQLYARKQNGERTEDLAVEIGMSRSGLCYAFARLREVA